MIAGRYGLECPEYVSYVPSAEPETVALRTAHDVVKNSSQCMPAYVPGCMPACGPSMSRVEKGVLEKQVPETGINIGRILPCNSRVLPL